MRSYMRKHLINLMADEGSHEGPPVKRLKLHQEDTIDHDKDVSKFSVTRSIDKDEDDMFKETEEPEGSDSMTDDDDSDNLSEISNLSGLSEEAWKPTSGAMMWIHKQISTGQNPLPILKSLIPDDAMIPDDLDNFTMWKIIINILSEPPPRKKLRHINTLQDVIGLLQSCKNIIVLTGAGVSVSCGIPDFRSRDGIYARLAVDFPDLPDPQAMFDIKYFKNDPRPFFKFAKEIYPGQFEPSASHKFINILEKQGKLLRNYTQNIDTLEQVAGISKVIQCHGSFATATCMVCKHKVNADYVREDIFNQIIPKCTECPKDSATSIMKPDIVFFGESLSDEFHKHITEDKDKCDLLIVIGSSLKVRPVALIPNSLPEEVPQILINREPLKHLHFDVELLGDCDTIVEELCKHLKWDNRCRSPVLQEISKGELRTPTPSEMNETDGSENDSIDNCLVTDSEDKSINESQESASEKSSIKQCPASSSENNAIDKSQKSNSENSSTRECLASSSENNTIDKIQGSNSENSSTRECPASSSVECQRLASKNDSTDKCEQSSVSEMFKSGCDKLDGSGNKNKNCSRMKVLKGCQETSKIGDLDKKELAEPKVQNNGGDCQRENESINLDSANLSPQKFSEHKDMDIDEKMVTGGSSTGDSLKDKKERGNQDEKPVKTSNNENGLIESNNVSEDSKTGTDEEEDDFEIVRNQWKPRHHKSLAKRLEEKQYLFLPPSRYVFSGAEVYSDMEYDSDSDDFSSSSSTTDDDSESSFMDDEMSLVNGDRKDSDNNETECTDMKTTLNGDAVSQSVNICDDSKECPVVNKSNIHTSGVISVRSDIPIHKQNGGMHQDYDELAQIDIEPKERMNSIPNGNISDHSTEPT